MNFKGWVLRFYFCFLIIFFCNLEAFADSHEDNNWTRFDFNVSKKIESQTEDIDFQIALNSFLANVFENNNGIDDTKGNLNFEDENFQMTSLTSLYEGENNSLLFQKGFFVSEKHYDYSGGLINRYAVDNFLWGINGFVDKKKENDEIVSLGGEFAYANTLKSYTHYVSDTTQEDLQFGLSFIVPYYRSVIFDINKNRERTNYRFAYKPYEAFSFNVLHKNFHHHDDELIFQIGFNFSFDKNFFEQLKQKDNFLEEIQRYDFLEKSY